MASTLHLLFPPPTPTLSLSRHKPLTLSCSSTPNPQPDNPTTDLSTRKPESTSSNISLPPLRGTAIQPADPPNFEIGWKRTKKIGTEKPKGWQIADFLEKLETLMGREFGSKETLAKVGFVVAERAREETASLRGKGEVEERLATELYRVLRLMEMDLEMVKASVKEETVKERVEVARARCRQAILVALSF